MPRGGEYSALEPAVVEHERVELVRGRLWKSFVRRHFELAIILALRSIVREGKTIAPHEYGRHLARLTNTELEAALYLPDVC